MTGVFPGKTSAVLAGIVLSMLATFAAPDAYAQGTGGSVSEPAETTPDSAALLRDSVRQMLEQAEVERSQAAQYRALAEAAGDAADRAERTARAEALEANAERLVRRAAEMEGEIAEFEAERARFREQSVGRFPDSMIGRWQAAYIDSVDGPVFGEVLVRRDGHSIDVDYGERRYHALSVEPSDGRFTIELQETQPVPRGTDYAPPGQEIAAEQGALTLSLADGENTITLATPEAAEPGRVRLVLSADEQGRHLSGHWFQRVDAVSGRDDAGGGRNGYPILGSRESGGVVMFGREIWRRPQAVIKLAFATENQAGLDEFGQPDWPDPDGATGGGRPVTLAEQRRVLYVLGYGLPEYRGEPVAIESLDEDVDYRLHSLEEDMQRSDFEGFFGNLLRDARNRIEATEAAGSLAVPITGDETRLLISAMLKPGAKPGPKTFRINGAEATWHLTFGDHRAGMMFVRDLADGLENRGADIGFQPEATDVLMRPETVYFEIRAARPLPYAEIPLLFSLNERALIFGESRRVPAFRTDDDPLVYRTGPIRIADPMEDGDLPEGAIRIGAYSGDRLTVTLGLEAGMVIAGPPAASALIADHPAESQLMAAVSENEPAFFWDRAVRDAAACHDISSAGAAIDDLARQPAEAIDRYLLISWLDNDAWDLSTIGSRWGKQSVPGRRDDAVFRLAVDISVGQHGAMILTRRALVNALKEQRRLLDELVDDGHVRGFRGTIERVMSGRTPWDDLKVTGPDGAQIFFPQTFYDGILERRYALGGADLIAYQLAATREALGLMKRHIDQAIALAAEPEDCDVEDMLILTGLGMRNVIERAKTVLMRCPDPDQSNRLGAAAALTGGRCRTWVADRRARAHMDALALIGASFSEQKAVAEWDHSVALLMASAVTMPVGAWGGAVGAAISAAVGTGGTIIGTVGGIATERAEQRELDFARGAAIVIGNDRYAVARQFDISYIPVIINTMLGVFQIGNDVAAIRNAFAAQRSAAAAAQLRIRMDIQAAYREARVELGRLLAQQMLRREVSLASLSRRQAGDLSMAIAEARALENSIGREAMETAELSALRFSELVESGEISPIAWSRRPPDGSGPPSVPPERTTGFDPDATVELDMPRFDPLEETGVPERAWWSHALDDDAYRRLRSLPMAERDDIIRLATREPEGFAAVMAEDHALEALYRPQQNLESLQDDVRRLGDRAPPRGRPYYEQAHPDAGDPDHLHFDIELAPEGTEAVITVYAGRPAPSAGPAPDADSISTMVARGQMTQVGYFKLSLEGDAVFDSGRQVLVLDTIHTFPNVDVSGLPVRDPTGAVRPYAPGPTWVRDVDVPLRADTPGAPFAMYSEHRGMQALGVGYADGQIGAVQLRNVQNTNTAIELDWLRDTFPTTPDSELIRHTSLYRHTESMLEQAGYRITDARFAREGSVAVFDRAGSLVDNPWFNPGRGGASLEDARNEFLSRFGLSRRDDIEIGFDIDLRVEPIAN